MQPTKPEKTTDEVKRLNELITRQQQTILKLQEAIDRLSRERATLKEVHIKKTIQRGHKAPIIEHFTVMKDEARQLYYSGIVTTEYARLMRWEEEEPNNEEKN